MKMLSLAAALALGGGHAAAQSSITVGYAPIAETEAVFAAADQGYFKSAGLDVTMVQIGPNAVQGLAADSVQIASVPSSSLLQAVDNGIDLVVVAGCGIISPRVKSVAAIAHTGVTIGGPADFVGKKIGVPSIGAFLDVVFRRWLVQNKVDPSTATFIEVPIPNTVDALKSGIIDVMVAGEPFVSRAVESHAGTVISYFTTDLPEGTPYTVFAAMRSWASAHPKEIAAFQKAAREGADFARSSPAEMKGLVSKYTKLPAAVVNSVPAPECKADFAPPQYNWLIDVLVDQKLLSKKLDPASFQIGKFPT
jgi:NitT/TauT family transport system substrate-binding protein